MTSALRFAWARPALMGTYIVDIVAMAFALVSTWVGGLVCLAGVIATGFALPSFWSYRSSTGDSRHRLAQ